MGVIAGVIAIVLVRSTVFLVLASFKGLIVLAVLALLFVFLRGPRDNQR